MVVNSIMLTKDNLITVSPKATIKEALDIIDQKNLLSIPVAENDKFFGAISKDRIYAFYFEKCADNKQCFLSDFKVENAMRTDIPVIHPMSEMEEAVHFLEKMNISFVAVVDEFGTFKGILTHHAVFEQFTQLFGLNKGQRLAVIAFDIPGQISRLSKIITENHGDIISFVVVDPRSVTDVREIVMRVRTNNIENIAKKVKEAGFQVQ